MLKDIASYFPNDQLEWDRDMSRIILLYRSRGLPCFTIDFPALDKALCLSLSRRRLDLADLNHSGSRFPGTKIPRLFWGLWSRLFDLDGCLKQDIDPNVVTFLHGLLQVGKNLEMDCAPKYLFEAIKEFYDVEAQTPVPDPIWEGDGVDISRESCGSLLDYHIPRDDLLFMSPNGDGEREARLLNAVQQYADIVAGDLGIPNPEVFRLKHGPGAVSDLPGGRYKYDFPSWTDRLEPIFPYSAYGSTPLRWDGVDARTGVEIPYEESASRLIAVPKTQKGPRLIAAEPTCHQWVQQGLRDYLYSYVRRSKSHLNHSITFRDQRPSGELALLGSRSGQLATVDLKSASDRLSTHVVQRVFRANPMLLGMMVACRTRFIRPPRIRLGKTTKVDSKSPSLHKLRKFSTQGSALTFPIQSIVFAVICVGVGKYHHPHRSWRSLARQVRVFGDDIIVPVAWEPQLRQVLHLLGLRVNDTKTFATGNFRESCGTDAWMGYDITPPHVTCVVERSNARSVCSNVAVSNNFYRKGWWHSAVWLQRQLATRYLRVVGHRSGTFGLTSYTGAPSPTKERWNEMLQYNETRVEVILSRSKSVKQDTAGTLLEFMTRHESDVDEILSGIGPHENLDYSTLVAVDYVDERIPPLRPGSGPNQLVNVVLYEGKNGSLRLLTPNEYESGVVQAGDPVIRVIWVPSTSLE